MAPAPLDQLQVGDFTTHLGSSFQLVLAEGTFRFELREAKTVGTPRPGVARAPFSLTLRATGLQPLPQAIYRLEHPALGALEIFLVPVGRDADGFLYEANFN
jgi:hypothetical protein